MYTNTHKNVGAGCNADTVQIDLVQECTTHVYLARSALCFFDLYKLPDGKIRSINTFFASIISVTRTV